MANLVGLHDREGIVISPQDTWILDTIALSENPAPFIYSTNWHWITRVNWGYGSTGTIPLPSDDNNFLHRLRTYILGSPGCWRWVIGNEPSLPREWPNSQPIHPFRYAEFYIKCREMIHHLPGHERDEVLIAASGPWNNQYQYAGNPNGDWIKYFIDIISACPLEKIDGFSLHAYTHGYDPNLVTSEAMMDMPFQSRHYNFRVYRDYCNTITDDLAHLPIYITEANGDGPWQAVKLIPAMAREINDWNKTSTGRKIKSLIFYRYPKYDQYHISDRPDVIEEYKNTATIGYVSPETPMKKIEPPPPLPEKLFSGVPTATVKASKLNVRNRPGTQNTTIVGYKEMGNKVSILEQATVDSNVWYRIGENQWVTGIWIEQDQQPNTGNNWQKSLAFVLRWEGGWADDPNDPGGATMKGITIETYTKWRKEKGRSTPTKEDLRNITNTETSEIYYNWYWLPSGADRLPWPECLAVFDLAVNGGVGKANQFKSEVGTDFIPFMARRIDWYSRLDNFQHFGRAWIRRCADLMREAIK